MDNNNNNEHVHILEEYCTSDDISLDGLRDKLNQITQPTALACSHFLHELCLNKNVTHDMVQLVLENNPYAAHCVSNRYHGVSYTNEDVDRYEKEQYEVSNASDSANLCSDRSYPVHLAALNVHCPNSVVELLAKSYPSALSHICILDSEVFVCDNYVIEGTPLHYYLSRTSNLQLDTVKILVELCPESLNLSGTNELYFPIHAIIDNPKVGSHHDILQYLISIDTTILQCRDEFEQTPLHLICCSKHVTVELVQVLVDGYQDATRQSDCGPLPIHRLCENRDAEETVKLDALRILIDAYPESLQVRNSSLLDLPIHIASRSQGPVFCKMLVDSYPNSLRVEDSIGCLPFHLACGKGSLETVKYLYEADRECINKSTQSGFYPIHTAMGTRGEEDTSEITKFLLQCDPDCVSIALPTGSGYAGYLPLHLAVVRFACLETVQLLFDAYPAAIYVKEARSRGGVTPVNLINVRNGTVGFLLRQENNISRFSERNVNFPLHLAVQYNVTLGVFKYLVEGIPGHKHGQDNEGKTTLHLACEYGNIGIVKYLIQRSKENLSVPDSDGNFPLHLACREGHCDVINSLLEANTVSVSIQNSDKKSPIELLIGSNCDQDSLEYTEAVWRLLVASPPTF